MSVETNEDLYGEGYFVVPPVRRKEMLGADIGRQEICDTIVEHQDLIVAFTKAWYKSRYTFRSTKVFGRQACKIPLDLWVLHELFFQYRFQTVIETGTAQGGSALWYALLMDLLQIPDGQVLTVDIEADNERPAHPRIQYIRGNAIDRGIYEWIKARVAGPVLVCLDSDHHTAHVRQELDLYAPLIPVNGWLVVEDTNGAPVEVLEDGSMTCIDEGPLAAINGYLLDHPGEWMREVVCERYWLTMNPGGWLQRVAASLTA
jgi:cephalosporin hydroxylase